MLFDILELRAYARAKREIDSAKKQDDVTPGPWVDRVFESMAKLMKRRWGHG